MELITRNTKFCLYVDDFGIKYYNDEDVNHLLSSLKDHYDITIDWNGNNYCGLKVDWNYQKQYVDISMPGYIAKVLRRFQHIKKKGNMPHMNMQNLFMVRKHNIYLPLITLKN